MDENRQKRRRIKIPRSAGAGRAKRPASLYKDRNAAPRAGNACAFAFEASLGIVWPKTVKPRARTI
jgi:hypothetical protein